MKKLLISDGRGVSYPLQSIVAFTIVLTMVGFYFVGINSNYVSYESEDVDISAKAIDVAERLLSDPGQAKSSLMDWELDPSNISVLGLNARPAVSIGGAENSYYVQGTSYGSDGISDSDIPDPPHPGSKWIKAIKKYQHQVGNYSIIYTEEVWIGLFGIPYSPDNGGSSPDIFIDGADLILTKDGNDYIYELKGKNNFPYAVLDDRKIENLSKIDYRTAKAALGLDDRYDFSIEIIASDGSIILSYPSSIGEKTLKTGSTREIVSICSRDVLIRHAVSSEDYVSIVDGGILKHFTYIYEPAKMIVKIF